jgi:hypothetical protein
MAGMLPSRRIFDSGLFILTRENHQINIHISRRETNTFPLFYMKQVKIDCDFLLFDCKIHC